MSQNKPLRSRTPQKMKAYGSFSAWKKDQTAKNQKLIGQLERLVKKVTPHLTTGVKWGQGCWVDDTTPKMYIHAEDDHIQFGFYSGSSLKDPRELLVGSGKYVRHVKVRTAKDIDPNAFTDLIKQTTAGKKARSTKTSKTCSQGHTFFKSSDCPTCPICEKKSVPKGVFSDMSSPVRGALDHAGIKTLKQLSKKTEREILDMHGIGPSSMPIFKKKLKKEGLSFKK